MNTTTSYTELVKMIEATNMLAEMKAIKNRVKEDGIVVSLNDVEFIASETQESIHNDCKGDTLSSEINADHFWGCVEETIRMEFY